MKPKEGGLGRRWRFCDKAFVLCTLSFELGSEVLGYGKYFESRRSMARGAVGMVDGVDEGGR